MRFWNARLVTSLTHYLLCNKTYINKIELSLSLFIGPFFIGLGGFLWHSFFKTQNVWKLWLTCLYECLWTYFIFLSNCGLKFGWMMTCWPIVTSKCCAIRLGELLVHDDLHVILLLRRYCILSYIYHAN